MEFIHLLLSNLIGQNVQAMVQSLLYSVVGNNGVLPVCRFRSIKIDNIFVIWINNKIAI